MKSLPVLKKCQKFHEKIKYLENFTDTFRNEMVIYCFVYTQYTHICLFSSYLLVIFSFTSTVNFRFLNIPWVVWWEPGIISDFWSWLELFQLILCTYGFKCFADRKQITNLVPWDVLSLFLFLVSWLLFCVDRPWDRKAKMSQMVNGIFPFGSTFKQTF